MAYLIVIIFGLVVLAILWFFIARSGLPLLLPQKEYVSDGTNEVKKLKKFNNKSRFRHVLKKKD